MSFVSLFIQTHPPYLFHNDTRTTPTQKQSIPTQTIPTQITKSMPPAPFKNIHQNLQTPISYLSFFLSNTYIFSNFPLLKTFFQNTLTQHPNGPISLHLFPLALSHPNSLLTHYKRRGAADGVKNRKNLKKA